MRTRWMLATSILLLASIPGALGATEEAGCGPAAAVAAITNAPASEPSPTATALPILANLPTQTPAQQTPQGIDDKPLFLLTTCSSCPPAPRCRNLHSCVLMGCC